MQDLIQRVATRYKKAVDCRHGTTWGWIDPHGKFYNIKGGTHGNWAAEHFPDEVERYMLQNLQEYQRYLAKEHSPDFWRQVFESFHESYKDDSIPKPFGIKKEKQFTLNLGEITDSKILRRVMRTPTLSGGSWRPSTRLTREENNLVMEIEAHYADAITEQLVDADTPTNRRRLREWNQPKGAFRNLWIQVYDALRAAGDDYLLQKGWVRASSIWAGQDNGHVGPEAWDSFFMEAFQCLPEDFNPMDETFWHNNDRMKFAEGLERLTNRKVQDIWWGRVYSQKGGVKWK